MVYRVSKNIILNYDEVSESWLNTPTIIHDAKTSKVGQRLRVVVISVSVVLWFLF